MHKIDGAGHVNNTFVSENIATNRPPTEFTADWFNAVQEELVNVIAAAGLTLEKSNNAQLLSAIRQLTIGVGVFNSVLKPVNAPSPEPFLVNSNGEVFMWGGANWLLIANGYSAKASQTADINLSSTVPVSLVSLTMPRAGEIQVNTSQFLHTISGSSTYNGFYLYKNGALVSRLGLIQGLGASINDFENSGSTQLTVAAGDVISVYGAVLASGVVATSRYGQDSLICTYIK